MGKYNYCDARVGNGFCNQSRGHDGECAVTLRISPARKAAEAIAECAQASDNWTCPHVDLMERLIEAACSQTVAPGAKWPQRCDLCDRDMDSANDRMMWHGLGNCVEICERCTGSGIEPKAAPPAVSTPRLIRAAENATFHYDAWMQLENGGDPVDRESIAELRAAIAEAKAGAVSTPRCPVCAGEVGWESKGALLRIWCAKTKEHDVYIRSLAELRQFFQPEAQPSPAKEPK